MHNLQKYPTLDFEAVQAKVSKMIFTSVIAAYKPKYIYNLLQKQNITTPLVMVGDFNIDVANSSNNSFYEFILQNYKCNQLITQPTTNEQTMLTLISIYEHQSTQ